MNASYEIICVEFEKKNTKKQNWFPTFKLTASTNNI